MRLRAPVIRRITELQKTSTTAVSRVHDDFILFFVNLIHVGYNYVPIHEFATVEWDNIYTATIVNYTYYRTKMFRFFGELLLYTARNESKCKILSIAMNVVFTNLIRLNRSYGAYIYIYSQSYFMALFPPQTLSI